MTRRQWASVAVIAALIVIPMGLRLARDDTRKEVDVEHVTLRALTPTVLASGSLTYESQVTLAPEVTGRVTEILVDEGDQVKRNQLLMRLDPAAPRAAVEQSQAQVRQARLSIERRQVDFDTQVTKVRRFEALRVQRIRKLCKYKDLRSLVPGGNDDRSSHRLHSRSSEKSFPMNELDRRVSIAPMMDGSDREESNRRFR